MGSGRTNMEESESRTASVSSPSCSLVLANRPGRRRRSGVKAAPWHCVVYCVGRYSPRRCVEMCLAPAMPGTSSSCSGGCLTEYSDIEDCPARPVSIAVSLRDRTGEPPVHLLPPPELATRAEFEVALHVRCCIQSWDATVRQTPRGPGLAIISCGGFVTEPSVLRLRLDLCTVTSA